MTPTPTPAPIAALLELLLLLIVPDAVEEMGTDAGLEAKVEVVGTFWGNDEDEDEEEKKEEKLLVVLENVAISRVLIMVPIPRPKT
jgi:hypothetical protein